MKFSEYLASFITPQMTLLEKFNAMCKYLNEEQQILYKHTINVTRISDSSRFAIIFIDTSNKTYTLNELSRNGFFDSKLNVQVNNYVVSVKTYQGYNVLIYATSLSGDFAELRFNGLILVDQVCEEYEN